jgi:ankyrin repeat protein
MDSLAKKLNRKEVRKAIKSLPAELDNIYDETMERIRSQNEGEANLAIKILYWISYAFRPLTVTEIQHALAVEPGDAKFDKELLLDDDILVSVCAGLVIIDRESNIIRLVHYTTQEYFERTRTVLFPDAQKSMAIACLTYLSFDVFAENRYSSDREIETRLQEYPLLAYAARYWGDHARGEPEEAVKVLALEFLEHDSKRICSNRFRQYRNNEYWSLELKERTGLQIAASFGLTYIVRLMLERGADISAEGIIFGWTALHWAANNGHEAVAQLLLQKGADVNKMTVCKESALRLSAVNGHEAVVRLLLDNKADVNESGTYDWPVLHGTIENGHDAVVRVLLEKGASIGVTWKGSTALSVAVDNGHETIVQQLLENGAEVSSPMLYEAASRGYGAVVRLLIKKGANVNAKTEQGRTALHGAAEEGQEATVRLLAEEGVDLTAEDESGTMAIHLAAANGHQAVVRLLLEEAGVRAGGRPGEMTPRQAGAEATAQLYSAVTNGDEQMVQLLLGRGADATAKDKSKCTLLHQAAKGGYEAVARLLLKSGADTDAKDEFGLTALHEAAKIGHEAVVLLLLEKEANVDVMGLDENGTALHIAACNGHETVVRILLQKGANVNAKDESGWTALHKVTEKGYETMMRLLIKKGADVTAKDIHGQTPFLLAAATTQVALVRALLELHRVDLESKDEHGRTALLCAVDGFVWRKGGGRSLAKRDGLEAVVRLLMEEGANIHATIKGGQTSLHLAARKETAVDGDVATARLLVEKGLELDPKDNNGLTPLSTAVTYGRLEIVQMLLESGADPYIDLEQLGNPYLYGGNSDNFEAAKRAIQRFRRGNGKLLRIGRDSVATRRLIWVRLDRGG